MLLSHNVYRLEQKIYSGKSGMALDEKFSIIHGIYQVWCHNCISYGHKWEFRQHISRIFSFVVLFQTPSQTLACRTIDCPLQNRKFGIVVAPAFCFRVSQLFHFTTTTLFVSVEEQTNRNKLWSGQLSVGAKIGLIKQYL